MGKNFPSSQLSMWSILFKRKEKREKLIKSAFCVVLYLVLMLVNGSIQRVLSINCLSILFKCSHFLWMCSHLLCHQHFDSLPKFTFFNDQIRELAAKYFIPSHRDCSWKKLVRFSSMAESSRNAFALAFPFVSVVLKTGTHLLLSKHLSTLEY